MSCPLVSSISLWWIPGPLCNWGQSLNWIIASTLTLHGLLSPTVRIVHSTQEKKGRYSCWCHGKNNACIFLWYVGLMLLDSFSWEITFCYECLFRQMACWHYALYPAHLATFTSLYWWTELMGRVNVDCNSMKLF